jgi:flagella basal body P-ring formation protein FlgA
MKQRLSSLALLACASACHASNTAQSISAAELCTTVRGLVNAAAEGHALRATVDCPHARDLHLVTGALSWSLLEQPAWVSGPGRIALKVVSQGGVARQLAVPVALSISSMAWIARRDLAAGTVVSASDVEWREHRWPIGAAAFASDAIPQGGRAKQAIRAGDVVIGARLVPRGELLQGDAVTAALRTSGVTIELPAMLVADARVGGNARVQLKGRRQTLQGVLVDPSTVIVEQ